MKKLLVLILGSLLISCTKPEEVILVLKPGADDGKDAQIRDMTPPMANAGRNPNLFAKYSSNSSLGGYPIQRGLIEFDLSSIPQDATILSAELHLFHDVTTAGNVHEGQNRCVLLRITEPWLEFGTQWSNQPKTTHNGRVVIPATPTATSDLTIDVTKMVADMIVSYNYGWMFRLVDETHISRQTYASSDNSDSSRWPELVVVYERPGRSSVKPFAP